MTAKSSLTILPHTLTPEWPEVSHRAGWQEVTTGGEPVQHADPSGARHPIHSGVPRRLYIARMDILLSLLATLAQYSRPALFLATCVAGVLCAISWAARSRRISPFTPLGRFARAQVDPRLRGIEAMVLNAGGSPTTVPWWGLAAFVVLGILAQSLLGYLIDIIASVALGMSSGPRGVLRALVQLTFAVLQIALMVRVLSSWFGGLARARWLRWTFTITEPLLAPLRAVLPSLGPFDISPLVLYYLLQFIGAFIIRAI